MKAAKPLFASLPMLLLAGCAFQPAPKVETPPAWASLAAMPAGEQPPSAQPIDAKWWTRFGSDELTGFINEALDRGPTLKVAINQILEAEAQAKIAGASLYPSLQGGLSATRNSSHPVANGPAVVSTNYEGTLSASYQVDLFGEVRDQASSAKESLKASIYNEQTVAITLVSNVLSNYLQAVAFRQERILAENELKLANEILDVVKAQRRVGTGSDLTVAQQANQVAAEAATIPALRNNEQQSLNALAVLLGRKPEELTVKAQSLDEVKLPAIAADIPSEVLTRRPDVRQAEATLKADNFNIAAARAARFPQISLTADGGTASNALANLFKSGTFFYSLAGSATQAIFEGGRLQGEEQLARATYRAELETYRQTILAAFSDVENALTQVTNNAVQYSYAQEAYTEANTAYRLSDLQYRQGVATFETVLQAQSAAFSAQNLLVQAQLARLTAVVSLAQAVGGGWDGMMPNPPPLSTLYGPA